MSYHCKRCGKKIAKWKYFSSGLCNYHYSVQKRHNRFNPRPRTHIKIAHGMSSFPHAETIFACIILLVLVTFGAYLLLQIKMNPNQEIDSNSQPFLDNNNPIENDLVNDNQSDPISEPDLVEIVISQPSKSQKEIDVESFEELNDIREENGLMRLKWNDKIYELVKFQASKDLCNYTRCDHQDSDGKYFDDYVSRFGIILRSGYSSGENIAGSNCIRALSLWMGSTTGHREIMLNSSYTDGAIAYDKENCVFIGLIQ
ncbi:MAG: CAP domain-containing protein [Candidatus Diapherotrites archaeon]|nr:CAP domain-containing protein [Candidatus Diapherotrites archaeon]